MPLPSRLPDGSSPLARGTHRGSAAAQPARRFIPARAGNTGKASIPARTATVHPRSRGEHPGSPGRPSIPSGSSPLARGTLADRRPFRAPLRFIPARAGNTPLWAGEAVPPAVHPRSRGEHHTRGRWSQRSSGSSPLARGTRVGGRGGRDGERFIPARAGNTVPNGLFSPNAAVHPRSRGEHATPTPNVWEDDGSSPLARGTRRCSVSPATISRFIPARAGNTPLGTASSFLLHGSSPLARGTRLTT